LLSGAFFGKSAFEISAAEQELYVSNLKSAAAELALGQNIMESVHQSLQLLLNGSALLLPDEVLVWQGPVITQDALEAQLWRLLTQRPK